MQGAANFARPHFLRQRPCRRQRAFRIDFAPRFDLPIDRFELVGGRIVKQEVWNDLAEVKARE